MTFVTCIATMTFLFNNTGFLHSALGVTTAALRGTTTAATVATVATAAAAATATAATAAATTSSTSR